MAERPPMPPRPESPLDRWRGREIKDIGTLGRAIREIINASKDYELYKVAQILTDWRISGEFRARHAEKLFKILEERYGVKISPTLKEFLSKEVPLPPEAVLVSLR